MPAYAYLTPVEGQTHDPDTWDKKRSPAPRPGEMGPWCYMYNGDVKSIYGSDGQPRPIPIEEARVAFAYFTPRILTGEQVPKVDKEIIEGELELRVPTTGPITGPCHLCGKDIPIGELSKHVVECAGGKSAATSDATEEDEPLEDLSRAELAELADERKIPYPPTSTKAGLIKLLEAAGVK